MILLPKFWVQKPISVKIVIVCFFFILINEKKSQSSVLFITKFRQRRCVLSSNFISLSVSIQTLDHYSVFFHVLQFFAFLCFPVVSHLCFPPLNAFFLKQRVTKPSCSLLPPKTRRDHCHHETVISFFLNSAEVIF